MEHFQKCASSFKTVPWLKAPAELIFVGSSPFLERPLELYEGMLTIAWSLAFGYSWSRTFSREFKLSGSSVLSTGTDMGWTNMERKLQPYTCRLFCEHSGVAICMCNTYTGREWKRSWAYTVSAGRPCKEQKIGDARSVDQGQSWCEPLNKAE